jgi:chemotaxis protein MotB
MKTFKTLTITICVISLTSCVSKKKFNSMEVNYKKSQDEAKICDDQLKNAQASNTTLSNQKKQLEDQIDYLKKNNSQVLGALQDMSVLSNKQAESVKQSLENISGKDAYIKNLQSAISRKDSLNMNLVLNLKGAIGDLNDKDINIKVEKGVVYVDISDKLLFNSGKYAVTDKAKIVLGKVAKVLNAQPDIEFMVEGYTDNLPIHTSCIEDNWDLSVKRATSVVRILQTEYKINPERMTAAGHSEYQTVASNNTPEGKAANRRTRIIILPQLDQFFKLLIKK